MTRSRKRKLQRLHGGRTAARAVVAGVPALIAGMSVAYAQSTTSGGLEEIVVTAQKRAEDLQSVPLSIQALGTQKLEQLNVQKFDDYVKFLPSVSYQTAGPGFAAVYMRGVASGGDGNHSGPLPSVGIYLDEQPITTIQGALDIHMYDIQRVEALAGPQGTLYGASSQAGTLRIITNKPDPKAFDAGYGLEVNSISGGGIGYLAEGFANLPINDRSAVRLVGWHRKDAGYIDNVLRERTYATSGAVASSAKFVEDDYNDVETTGGRAALRIDLNDNWTITPTVMAQSQDSNGNFSYDTSVGKNEIAHIKPEFSTDSWVQAALTVEGKIANLDMTYAGSYLKRDVYVESDYSDYSYWYDQLLGYGAYWYDDAGDPVDPTQFIHGKDKYNRNAHELRFATDADKRVRFVGGAFYQRQEHDIQQRYMINGISSEFVGGTAPDISVTGWPNTIWLTKQLRVDKDWALFGELSFDITEKLTATAGARYFDSENSLKGFFGYSLGYSPQSSGTPETYYGEKKCDYLAETTGQTPPTFHGAPCKVFDKVTQEDGWTPRVNLTYKFTPDALVYATYSEGFRPGGINRRGTLPPYIADWLKSFEVGWKTTWMDNRLRWNGAVFDQKWDDFQFALLGLNGLTEIKNAGQAEIKGIETDVAFAVTDGFSVNAGVAWLDAKLTENYCGETDDNGNPITKCDTPQAPKGTRLPVTPEWKANATARYEFPVAGFDSFLQGSVIYVGEREADLRIQAPSDYDLIDPVPIRKILGTMPSYTTVDVSAGFGRNDWNLQLYVTNLFNDEAQVSRYVQCLEEVCADEVYVTPQRPRMIGLKFSQEF